MRKRFMGGIAALSVSLALSGCTGGDHLVPEYPDPTSTSPAAPTKTDASKPPADEHPLDAVRAALRRLDACALIDPAVATSSGMTAKPWMIPDSPHKCTVTGEPQLGNEITVTLGNGLSPVNRYNAQPMTLAGAKAYQDGKQLPEQCRIEIPVSRELAVQFRYRLGHGITGDACAAVEKFAAAGAALLANTEALVADVAKRPLVDRDACTLLRQAMATDTAPLVFAEEGIYGLDGCDARSKDPKIVRGGFELETTYGLDPMAGTNVVTRPVGSKQARVHAFPTSCKLEWSPAPSGLGGRLNGFTVLTVRSDNCDAAADLAGRIERVLGERAEPAKQEPVRRLLYAPEESDSAEVGACVDFVGDGSVPCKPYEPISVGGTTRKILEDAKDARIGCAIAADAVKEVLGDTFRPVVWGASCFFVEPTHTYRLRMVVDPNYIAQEYGADTTLYKDRRVTQSGGKPAVTFTSKGRSGTPASTYSIYVAPNGDLAAPGIVAGLLEALPARGAKDETAPDTSKLPLLDQVMSKIVTRWLTR